MPFIYWAGNAEYQKQRILEFLNKNKYHSNTINMFSNDDYEFEDLANQMSQTQINESGNIGGLSMLWISRSVLTFISWKY